MIPLDRDTLTSLAGLEILALAGILLPLFVGHFLHPAAGLVLALVWWATPGARSRSCTTSGGAGTPSSRPTPGAYISSSRTCSQATPSPDRSLSVFSAHADRQGNS